VQQGQKGEPGDITDVSFKPLSLMSDVCVCVCVCVSCFTLKDCVSTSELHDSGKIELRITIFYLFRDPASPTIMNRQLNNTVYLKNNLTLNYYF